MHTLSALQTKTLLFFIIIIFFFFFFFFANSVNPDETVNYIEILSGHSNLNRLK